MRTKIQSVDWTGVILDVSLIVPERPQVHDGGLTRSWNRWLSSVVLVAVLAGPRRRRAGDDVPGHADSMTRPVPAGARVDCSLRQAVTLSVAGDTIQLDARSPAVYS